MFGALAEFERSLIRERTQAGLAAARRAGRTGGRPPKLTEDDLDVARALLANPDIGVTQIAHRLGVSPATLYRRPIAAKVARARSSDAGDITSTPMLIGYARVSAVDQNLALQRDALTEAGCAKIFIEQMSGAVADRPALHDAVEIARSDDLLLDVAEHAQRERLIDEGRGDLLAHRQFGSGPETGDKTVVNGNCLLLTTEVAEADPQWRPIITSSTPHFATSSRKTSTKLSPRGTLSTSMNRPLRPNSLSNRS
jgi:hypothetical protein